MFGRVTLRVSATCTIAPTTQQKRWYGAGYAPSSANYPEVPAKDTPSTVLSLWVKNIVVLFRATSQSAKLRESAMHSNAGYNVKTSRDLGIQSLRGIAVVAMVSGHVIGSTSAYGMRVAETSGWRYAYHVLEDVRMPLFAAIAGFVFALRPPLNQPALIRLVTGKMARLLVPMACVGSLFFLVQTLVPDSNSTTSWADYPYILFYGFQHFWFLQAMFLIFVVASGISAVFRRSPRRVLPLLFILGLALTLILPASDDATLFSWRGAVQLFPFFILGWLVCLQAAGAPKVWPTVTACAVLAFGLTARELLGWQHTLWNEISSLAIGTSAILLLFRLRFRLTASILTWLGGFSFSIYLLHVFGSAGARIALARIASTDPAMQFLVSLSAGILLPVIIDVVATRFRVVRFLILGKRYSGPSLGNKVIVPKQSQSTEDAPVWSK